MKMPFGPYEDFEIEDIPPKYCKHLLGKVEVKNKQLKKELEERVETVYPKDEENK